MISCVSSTIFQHPKKTCVALKFQPVGRWDSRLELLTRYTAQLKGPRHPQFMQGVAIPGLRRAGRFDKIIRLFDIGEDVFSEILVISQHTDAL